MIKIPFTDGIIIIDQLFANTWNGYSIDLSLMYQSGLKWDLFMTVQINWIFFVI